MREFTLPRSRLWLAFVIPLAAALVSCGKRADSNRADPTPAQAPEDTAAAGPKVSVMIITYQTQMTPNQYSHPPGIMVSATRGQEIRYLDPNNKRMRLEKYVLENSGNRLYDTMIIDETGSYDLNPAKNEAVFTKMTTPGPVWNFDENVSTAWARQVNLTVDQQQFLGRTCDVVHMASSGNVWFWNEIPLKKELKTVGSEIDIEAYQIKEDASIPASLLQVPDGMSVR
jgi:hypothetical protein